MLTEKSSEFCTQEAKMSPKMLIFLTKYWRNVVKILTHKKSVTVPTCKTLLWSLLRRCQFYPDHHHHHQPCSSPSHISVSKHPALSLSDGAFSPSKSSLYNIFLAKYLSRKYQVSILRNTRKQVAGQRLAKLEKRFQKAECAACVVIIPVCASSWQFLMRLLPQLLQKLKIWLGELS